MARPAPDGGWGWAVVLGVALIFIVTMGPMGSFGIIFGEWLENINAGTSDITFINGLFFSLTFMPGVLARRLLRLFSSRQVSLAGGLLYSAGCCLSAFADSVAFMVITFSVLQGLGVGLLLPAAFTCLTSYFSTRRTLALAVTHTLIAAGVAVYPLLVHQLMLTYGFRGTQAVVGALSLHTMVGAATMKPLRRQRPTHLPLPLEEPQEDHRLSDSSEQLSEREEVEQDPVQSDDSNQWRDSHQVTDEVIKEEEDAQEGEVEKEEEERVEKEEKEELEEEDEEAEISKDPGVKSLSESPQLSPRPEHNLAPEEGAFGQDFWRALPPLGSSTPHSNRHYRRHNSHRHRRKRHGKRVVSFHDAHTYITCDPEPEEEKEEEERREKEEGREKEEEKSVPGANGPNGLKIELFSQDSLPSAAEQQMRSKLARRRPTGPPPPLPRWRRLSRRFSVLLRMREDHLGSTLSLADSDASETWKRPRPRLRKYSVAELTAECVDASLLHDGHLASTALGASAALFSDCLFSCLLPLHALSLGLGHLGAARLVLCLGAGDLGGRAALAAAATWSKGKAKSTFLAACLLTALLRAVFLVTSDPVLLGALTVGLGVCKAWLTVPVPNLFSEQYSADRFPAAYGLFLLCAGLIHLVFCPFVGLIRDVTGSYPICLGVLTSVLALCVGPWTIELLFMKKHPSSSAEEQP